MSKLTILYFYDDKPGPSTLQDSMIKNLELEFNKRVEFKRINVSKDNVLVKKYGITEIPSIVIERNEKVKEKFNGLTQELFLRRAIERFLKEI